MIYAQQQASLRVLAGLLSDRVRESEVALHDARETLAWARAEVERLEAEVAVRRVELRRWSL